MAKEHLDHVQLSVEDYPRAKSFYLAALAPLGCALMMEFPEQGPPAYGGFGADGKPFLWIGAGGRQTPTTHIAFGAGSAAEVDAFYKAALAAGGTDNGPPGTRAHYHPKYYAAFVRDPEGHNIEAVWHGDTAPSPAETPRRRRTAATRPAAKRAQSGKKPAARKATAPKAKPPSRTAKPAARKTAGRKLVARKPAGRGRAKPRRGR